MVDPLLDLLPDAEVWHLGLYRDEATLGRRVLQQASRTKSG